QRQQPLAGLGETHDQIAAELAGVKDVQWPVQVEGQEVGDIDQRRDRPETDRLEPVPEPARARAVSKAPYMPTEKQRAGSQIFDMDRDRRAEAAYDRARVERLQLSQPRGREIARDTAHRETIGAVRRHFQIDHRVVETEQARVAR